MSAINFTAVVRRNDRVLFAQVAEEYLALDSEREECFSLNGTAKDIWDQLATPVTVRDLCGKLQELYEVDDDRCQAEVTTLLNAWLDAGLVAVNEPR